MLDATVVLLVDVVEHAMEVAGLQVRGQRIGGAGEVQAITVLVVAGAVAVQALVVGRLAGDDRPEAPADEGQVVDVA
ncbi:hypothetical protein D3C80_1404700 [compost metagenome]